MRVWNEVRPGLPGLLLSVRCMSMHIFVVKQMRVRVGCCSTRRSFFEIVTKGTPLVSTPEPEIWAIRGQRRGGFGVRRMHRHSQMRWRRKRSALCRICFWLHKQSPPTLLVDAVSRLWTRAANHWPDVRWNFGASILVLQLMCLPFRKCTPNVVPKFRSVFSAECVDGACLSAGALL